MASEGLSSLSSLTPSLHKGAHPCCKVNQEYKSKLAQLSLQIVSGSGPNLLGRDWFSHIRFDLHQLQIHHIHSISLQALLTYYSAMFEESFGTLQRFQAKIVIEPGVTPRFNAAKLVSYALKEKVDKNSIEFGTRDFWGP